MPDSEKSEPTKEELITALKLANETLFSVFLKSKNNEEIRDIISKPLTIIEKMAKMYEANDVPASRIPVSYDGLSRLWKIAGYTLTVANEIDDFGVCMGDAGQISESLMKRTGMSLWRFRDACDELMKIHKEEYKRAKDWDAKFLTGDQNA